MYRVIARPVLPIGAEISGVYPVAPCLAVRRHAGAPSELADRIASNAVKETRPWQEDEYCRAIAPRWTRKTASTSCDRCHTWPWGTLTGLRAAG